MSICYILLLYIVLLSTTVYTLPINLPLQHTTNTYAVHTVNNQTSIHTAYHTQQLTHSDTTQYSIQATTPSVVTLTGCPSATFWASVTIGTQSFNLLLDTGSATTAVAGTQCTTCGVTPVYQPGTTATDLHSSVQSVYGDGSSWVGYTYSDTITFDSVSGVLNFAVIVEQSAFFPSQFCSGTSGQYQGILGLGYSDLLLGDTTAFNNIISDDNAISSVFSIQLCSDKGTLWMGGADPTYFNSPVQWVPVLKQSYFSVQLNDVLFDQQSIGFSSSAYGTVIIDSGSASFILPTNIYNSFVQTITTNPTFLQYFSADFYNVNTADGSSQCLQPTNNVDMQTLNTVLPTLQLQLQGVTLTLQAANSYILQYTSNSQTYYCPGIRPYDSKNTAKTIFGYTVLNQFITVFDTKNALVGFAASDSCTAGTNTQYTAITYQYVAGGYGDCTESCVIGGGEQLRNVVCKASNTQTVADSYCAGQSKPSDSMQCTQCSLQPVVAIGIISGASAAVALLIAIAVVWCCRKRTKRLKKQQQQRIIPVAPLNVATPTNMTYSQSNYIYTPPSNVNSRYTGILTPNTVPSTSMFTNRPTVDTRNLLSAQNQHSSVTHSDISTSDSINTYSPPPATNPVYASGTVVVPNSPRINHSDVSYMSDDSVTVPINEPSDIPVVYTQPVVSHNELLPNPPQRMTNDEKQKLMQQQSNS